MEQQSINFIVHTLKGVVNTVNNKEAHIPPFQVGVRTLYIELLSILDELGHTYELIGHTHTLQKTDPDSIILGHHTICSDNNVWNIKNGYIPNYLYFDKCGYSGWAEMADSVELFNKSQTVDGTIATEFVNDFLIKYSEQNLSKFEQSDENFSHNKPYIFVACQHPSDTVMELAEIETYDLARKIATLADSDIDVLIKIHPTIQNKNPKPHPLAELENLPNVHFTTASIHKLIAGSEAVVTVNSGVGFESLLYGKHVFTSGKSEYRRVTQPIKNDTDVSNIKNIIQNTEPNVEKINKFLFFMLNEYYMEIGNKDRLREKIISIIDQYQKSLPSERI